MKRLLVIVAAVLFIPLAVYFTTGFSPQVLPDAMRVGTGLSAKLACSGYYLSGFDDEKNARDIASYSPVVRLVTTRHVSPDSIEADVAGSFKAVARYFPGLGCTLQSPGMATFENLKTTSAPLFDGDWPQGNDVTAPLPEFQSLSEKLLNEDATRGLDTRALLVVQNGKILAEAYAPGISVNTPLLGWSMGKSLTAIMVARMEAMGQLKTEEIDLFPAWQSDARREISVKNLLQMSSGLDFKEPYVPGSDSTRMLFMSPSAADVALESSLAHVPGAWFYYSSGTSNLLNRLIYDRLGGSTQALIDFFAQEIVQPLGLRNTTLELDASGVFVGSSYIYAPARDWARMAQLLLSDGQLQGRQFLPKGWVKTATAANTSDNDPRYGYQLWLNGGGEQLRWPSLSPDAYAMMGNRGQSVVVFPSEKAIIVRLGWTSGRYPMDERMAPILGLLQKRIQLQN